MPVLNNPASGGMTRQRLIQLADQRTRRIAQGKLNLDQEFLALLQDFCSEYYWSWRKYSVGFDTTTGTQTYDIGPSDGSEFECEQLISVKVFPDPIGPTGGGESWRRLVPLYDTDSMDYALEDTTQGPPAKYFPALGDPDSLFISPIPDNVYHLRATYWALPNSRYDALPDQIPLVPAYLHRILAKGLEAQIYRFCLGEMSAQYSTAFAEYSDAKDRAALKRDFGTGKVREYTDPEHAIRST
jgi:hypothetical protein